MCVENELAVRLDHEVPATIRSSWTGGPSVVVVAIATLIFFVIVSRGFNFYFDQLAQSRFYENQAQSLLHGRVDVPFGAIGTEGIEIDGKFLGYFGPSPAILRLPVMLFASSDDPFSEPFLAPWYMTIAFALAGFAIAGVAARVGLDGWMAAAFCFVGLAGSALMTLSLRALVYEEATLWGASFALVTIWAALHVLETRSTRWAVVAAVAATLSLSARPTAGIGAIAVVVVVAVLRQWWGLLIGTVTASVGLYAAFMLWKFGALYPPLDQQLACSHRPPCLALAESGSTHPKFLPTNLFQYFRPDLLRLVSDFPWIAAPSPQDAPVKLIGIRSYLATDSMSSVTATMPALLAASTLGLVVTDWTRRWLILAACAGPLLTCMWLGATQRYLADFVPPLILASACGLAYLLSSRWRVIGGTMLAFLGAWSVIVCIALALSRFIRPDA